VTSDQKFSQATSAIPIVASAGDLLLTLRVRAEPPGNTSVVSSALGRQAIPNSRFGFGRRPLPGRRARCGIGVRKPPGRKPRVGRTLFARARPMGFWGRGGSARWEFGSSPKRERRGDCLGGRVARYQRTIRVEEAAAASALGQMPARCPAVGG